MKTQLSEYGYPEFLTSNGLKLRAFFTPAELEQLSEIQ